MVPRARVERRDMAVEAGSIEVTLPAMGESVTEGTILEWHKQEGDSIEADETLVEISTDKVDAEVPSPASGTILKIDFAEGDTVEVGAVLAEIAAGDTAPAGLTNGNGGGAAADVAPPAATGDGDGAAPGELVDLVSPAAGESVAAGTLRQRAVQAAA